MTRPWLPEALARRRPRPHARLIVGPTLVGIVLVFLLPVALAVSATLFWGRGVIEKEGVLFAANYLSDRATVAMIFDPRVNDFGTFQARELSYLADYLNVQVLTWLFDRGLLLLIPAGNVVALVAAMVVFARGARRLQVNAVAIPLLLAWFLSTIVMQSSVAIFYRSSKMLLLVSLLAFLFHACRLLDPRRDRPVRGTDLAGLFGLGLAMALVDRQGLFFLALSAGLAILWFVASPGDERPPLRVAAVVVATVAGAAAASELYNYVLAPWIIERLNGYRPDFSYQSLPIAESLGVWRFWDLGRVMIRDQARFFAGGVPLALVAALVAVYYAAHVWRSGAAPRLVVRQIARDVLVLAAAIAGTVLLASLMILRHPFVYTIPDHRYWYFFVPVQGVFLFGVTLLLVRLSRAGELRWLPALWMAIALFTVLNVAHLPSHRAAMLASGYFASEHQKSRLILTGFDRMKTGEAVPDGVVRWVSVGTDGGVLRLPVSRTQFFPDTLAAIREARRGTRPFDQLPGPHWLALREFVAADGSPLNYADQIAPLLDAWRAVGIREVHVRLDEYEDRAFGERTVEAIRAAAGRVTHEAQQGSTLVFTLAPAPAAPRPPASMSRLATATMTITASHGADRVPQLTDGNLETRWLTGVPQQGGEWIRVAFDRPRDVARVRLDLARRSYGDYARGLRIDSEAGGVSRTLYDGSILPPLVAGLLRSPARAPAEIGLPANRSEALVIRQTGAARVWYWSVHELAIWER